MNSQSRGNKTDIEEDKGRNLGGRRSEEVNGNSKKGKEGC